MDSDTTICALSSAPGRAGIAVVRLSGRDSRAIARSVLAGSREPLAPREATLVRFVDERFEMDEALATYFPEPHSYTGEDVVEISLHGSPVLVSALLAALCRAGARPAQPGEFTMRAFLNGRIDLAQAEAVRDVIEATTIQQARVAARQRSGELARLLAPLKSLLIDVIVWLESAVEFVEDEIPGPSRESIAAALEDGLERIRGAIDSYRKGRIIRDGFRLAIAGRPNVGKSSLFNALLGRDRSIVTEIPGTTRDVVSEEGTLEGIPVRLADTAGVRDSADRVEQLGVSRALGAIADSDLVLLVVDSGAPRTAEDDALRERVEGLVGILVANKSDLAPAWSPEETRTFAGSWPSIDVSARDGDRIPELRALMMRQLLGEESVPAEGILITNFRHCRCLESAEERLCGAAASLRRGLSEEFALADLHAALRKLGEITGETSVEDLLGEIFSRFCVGK